MILFREFEHRFLEKLGFKKPLLFLSYELSFLKINFIGRTLIGRAHLLFDLIGLMQT